jgi:signal transduction histidine kinase
MEAIARVAGGMAHNFNNLLTSIIGYSDLLLDGMADDQAARRSLRKIREAGERAAGLTRQLLAYSREQAMMPKALDLNALVGRVGRGLRARGTEGIEIRTCLGENLGPVTADPDQIEQAIVTLAVNARDAMPEGGRLTFATENANFDAPFVRDDVHVPPGDYVMLAVSDTGTGMDEDARNRIFEPFHTTKTSASGLGLAAVYGIVKQSGGYIWAFSRPEYGTTFEICLPRAGRVPGEAGAIRDGVRPPSGANRLPGGTRHVRRIDSCDAGNVLAGGLEAR